MMHILYFSFVELDIPNACQTHTLGVLEGFSENESHIHALIPRPLKMKPMIANVRFYYLWPWRFSDLGRAWIKLLSAFIMFYLCIKNKYDFIYVREMEQNPVPRSCSKLFKIPLYIEINDMIPLVLSEQKKSKKKINRAIQNQKKDLEHSSGIIVPSVPISKWLSRKYRLKSNKIHMILNGTKIYQDKELSKKQARKSLNISDKSLCLAFVGNLYQEYDFHTILKAIKKSQDIIGDIRLIIVGDGPLFMQLKRSATEFEISKNTIFTGYLPQRNLGKILPAADVGLLMRTKIGASRYGPLSTKLSTYALYKLAVIVAGETLDGYPDNLKNDLYLVQPENSDALVDTIQHLYSHSDEKNIKAENLHNYVLNNLNWANVTKKIIRIIENDNYLKISKETKA